MLFGHGPFRTEASPSSPAPPIDRGGSTNPRLCTTDSIETKVYLIIPFNRPYVTGRELWLTSQAHSIGQLAGYGEFTRHRHTWLENHFGPTKALLTLLRKPLY
jgi:hypothetical protein